MWPLKKYTHINPWHPISILRRVWHSRTENLYNPKILPLHHSHRCIHEVLPITWTSPWAPICVNPFILISDQPPNCIVLNIICTCQSVGLPYERQRASICVSKRWKKEKTTIGENSAYTDQPLNCFLLSCLPWKLASSSPAEVDRAKEKNWPTRSNFLVCPGLQVFSSFHNWEEKIKGKIFFYYYSIIFKNI